jgi:hypothetical protein
MTMTDTTMNDGAIETGNEAEASRERAIVDLRAKQNFALAIPAGIAAAVVGAVLWALFVYLTEFKLGLIVVVVGALVGYAIRTTGHGIDKQFGILGAACAAFGWALGTVLCDIAFVAKSVGRPFLDVLTNLGIGQSASLALRAADMMDLVFLAIAVWEGYKLSFRYRVR